MDNTSHIDTISPTIEEALQYLHRDFSGQSTVFDSETYQKNLKICLNHTKNCRWAHTDVSDQIKEINIAELINHAKVQVYWADFSPYPRSTPQLLKALKNAGNRGVQVHIALDCEQLPESWREIQDIPNIHFRKPKNTYLFADENPLFIVADDAFFSNYMYEDRNQYVLEVVTAVETHSEEIDEFGMRVFGTDPMALTQAFETYDRNYKGLGLQDALNFVNYDFENNADFDIKTYRRNLRACLYETTPQSWKSSGRDGQIDKANIIEMIRRAKNVIYIVARTDSKNFDDETERALYHAKNRGVEINVAVQPTTIFLPNVWRDIKGIATQFCSTVIPSELDKGREYLVADKAYRCEMRDKTVADTDKWIGITRTNGDSQYAMINHFFYQRPWMLQSVGKHQQPVFSVTWHKMVKEKEQQNGN